MMRELQTEKIGTFVDWLSKHGSNELWTDGDEILVRDERVAEGIFLLMDMIEAEPHLGYYDPEDDERDNCVNEYTGYWYIDFD